VLRLQGVALVYICCFATQKQAFVNIASLYPTVSVIFREWYGGLTLHMQGVALVRPILGMRVFIVGPNPEC